MDSTNSKKTVGMVLHPYGEKEAAGLGRSILSLATAIIEQDPGTHYIVFLKGNESSDPVFKTSNYTVKRLKTSRLWLEALRAEKKLDAYIFFTPVTTLFMNEILDV